MMDPYQRNGVTAMRHDFLATLQEKAPSFSKGQRRIATYITESYDKAAFMTANRLGKVVGVSESTVVRFAMELGFDGYPGMQKAMQEMVVNRLTASQRIEVANDRIGDQDVVSMVLQSDADKLRQTGETVDRGEFQAAVNAILNAKRVYILGVRSAATLAGFLGYYLNYMFRDVHVVTASGASEMFEKIVGVGPDDVVIAFSFPRYSTTTAKGAQYCRSTGATVIGMTDSRLSPLGQNCDHVLLVKSDMVSLVDSLVAPLSVTNALIVAIAARREKELSKTFDNLEHIWEEYNVYEKQEDQP
jgi:DNA-binding MurR/RpiR family transcriptional regulator